MRYLTWSDTVPVTNLHEPSDRTVFEKIAQCSGMQMFFSLEYRWISWAPNGRARDGSRNDDRPHDTLLTQNNAMARGEKVGDTNDYPRSHSLINHREFAHASGLQARNCTFCCLEAIHQRRNLERKKNTFRFLSVERILLSPMRKRRKVCHFSTNEVWIVLNIPMCCAKYRNSAVIRTKMLLVERLLSDAYTRSKDQLVSEILRHVRKKFQSLGAIRNYTSTNRRLRTPFRWNKMLVPPDFVWLGKIPQLLVLATFFGSTPSPNHHLFGKKPL